jgi:hypothetical protein
MRVTQDDMRKMYERFNDADVESFLSQFAPDAHYSQLDSGNVAVGHDEIRQVLLGWRTCFEGARIEEIQMEPATQLVGDHDGATQCYVVDFVAVGRYVHTLPGLEETAPAMGEKVRVPIGDTVWLNADGQIIHVDNTVQVSALQ